MTCLLMARPTPRAPFVGADLRWLIPGAAPFSLALATLGPALVLWPDSADAVPTETPDLQTLARPALLCHACAVTPDGPRESLSLCDDSGAARVRLHRLPETDPLAWEALLRGARALPGYRHAPIGRMDRAKRLRFHIHRYGPCELLSTQPADTFGAFGWRTAQGLAASEGVPLDG